MYERTEIFRRKFPSSKIFFGENCFRRKIVFDGVNFWRKISVPVWILRLTGKGYRTGKSVPVAVSLLWRIIRLEFGLARLITIQVLISWLSMTVKQSIFSHLDNISYFAPPDFLCKSFEVLYRLCSRTSRFSKDRDRAHESILVLMNPLSFNWVLEDELLTVWFEFLMRRLHSLESVHLKIIEPNEISHLRKMDKISPNVLRKKADLTKSVEH